jgi:hypothetical protein
MPCSADCRTAEAMNLSVTEAPQNRFPQNLPSQAGFTDEDVPLILLFGPPEFEAVPAFRGG